MIMPSLTTLFATTSRNGKFTVNMISNNRPTFGA